jgi:hypothetical protein
MSRFKENIWTYEKYRNREGKGKNYKIKYLKIQNIHSTMEIQFHMTILYLMKYDKLYKIHNIFMHKLNSYRVGHVLPSTVSLFLLRI